MKLNIYIKLTRLTVIFIGYSCHNFPHYCITDEQDLHSFLCSSVLPLAHQRISQLHQERRRPLVRVAGHGEPVCGESRAKRHGELLLLHHHQHGHQHQEHLQQSQPAHRAARRYGGNRTTDTNMSATAACSCTWRSAGMQAVCSTDHK